jgi:hypothetical protein
MGDAAALQAVLRGVGGSHNRDTAAAANGLHAAEGCTGYRPLHKVGHRAQAQHSVALHNNTVNLR